MQASKNYELFCKRKINLHCHTLIFFMFIGSFTQACLGLLETFSWYPCFFRTYPATRQLILKISLSRSRAISKIALSRTFFPVPSESEIAGLDCIYVYVYIYFVEIRQSKTIFRWISWLKLTKLKFALMSNHPRHSTSSKSHGRKDLGLGLY